MELRVTLPDSEPPSAITEVMQALRAQKLKPVHDRQTWGDWINLSGHQSVISIESMRGLARSATLEMSEDDPDTLLPKLQAAFRSLSWQGEDEDGPYPL